MSKSDLLRFFKVVQNDFFTVIYKKNRITNQKISVAIGSPNSFAIFASSFNIVLDTDCWKLEDVADNFAIVNVHNKNTIYFQREV